MSTENAYSMQLRDRPEFASKAKPLTFAPTASVADAVAAMSERNYGSIIVVDDDEKVIGVMTERDVMKRLVHAERSAKETRVEDIMTRDPRVARETDQVLDWMRIMSNDRFRRLPVVDDDGRIKAVFTQGDLVSYTWPDLIYQAKELTKSTIGRSYPIWLIAGGVMLYSLLMVIVLSVAR